MMLLTFLAEQHHQVWAKELKDLLIHMKREVGLATASGACCLDPPLFEQLVTRYGQLIYKGYEANALEPVSPQKRRGKAKQSSQQHAIYWIVSAVNKKQSCVSCPTSTCLLITRRLSAIFAWSRCNKRFLAVSEVCLGCKPFAESVATFPRYASKG